MKKEDYYATHRVPEKVVHDYWRKLKHGNVLDLGCGAGDLGKYNNTKSKVYGIDIDRKAVEIASEFEVTKQADIEKTFPFDDNFFDSILARDVLEHVKRPERVVNEMKRVLKKGGVVVATVPEPDSKWFKEDSTHVRGFTKDSIEELFQNQSFEVLSVSRIGSIPMFGKMKKEHWIPRVLKIPLVNLLFTQGWEITARKK